MNIKTRNRFLCAAIAVLGLLGATVQAQAPQPPQPPAPTVERPAAEDAPEVEAPDTDTPDVDAATDADADEPIVWTRDRGGSRGGRGFGHRDDAIVSIGGDSRLEPDQRTDAVVSIFGSSTSAGDVRDAVVSVFGDTRVEGGRVGNAAVAVLGNTYINAIVEGETVAVLGDIELGPNADVRGDVVVIGGVLKRDPAAMLRGGVRHVMSIPSGALSGLRSWLENCVRYLRPLAFAPNLGWAWTIALGFLGLYAFIALMFREPVERCVKTLQDSPGQTVIASLLAMLLTPVLFVVLAITLVGFVIMPILSFAIFLATLFGKAVVLTWMGRGLLKLVDDGERLNAAIAALAGGVIVLLLYVVPVLGFLVYNLLGLLAFGVVVLTLLQAAKARRRNAPPPAYAAGGAGAGPFAPGGGMYATAGGPVAGGVSPGDASMSAGAPYEAPAASFASAADPAGAAGGAGYVPPAGSYAAPPGAPLPVNEAFSLPRAGFWIRMLALLIDTIIIGVAVHVLSHHGELHLVALAAYGAIMWKMKGTTIGGIVCNLKVVRLDGRPVDWSTAIVRALSCFLSLVVLGLGFIWIAFDEGKQSWHDKIAGTAVVRSPQGVSLL